MNMLADEEFGAVRCTDATDPPVYTAGNYRKYEEKIYYIKSVLACLIEYV